MLPALPAQATQLNDTGKTRCYEPVWGGGEIQCAGTGQDGDFGRDVTDFKPADGYAGFSYVKLGPGGEPLPNSATEWACVHDRITGLTWEVKTADGGLRDWQHDYTNLGNGAPTDASGFVQAVNAAGLCGRNDWRLPGRMELQSLVNYGRPAPTIVNRWFPNTNEWGYWTSTIDAPDIFGGHWVVSFRYGVVGGGGHDANPNAVRVVRGEPFPRHEHDAGRFVANGDQVSDTSTGLVWRRCAEGTTWDGATCTGRATRVRWKLALALANAAAYDGVAWRLPNATELLSLVDDRRYSPAIDTVAFPGLAGMSDRFFWSATPDTPSDGLSEVFEVNFFDGGLGGTLPASTRALLLVRVNLM